MQKEIIVEDISKNSTSFNILNLRWVNREAIIEIISVLFILLFIYASVSKLLDYEKFRIELGKSPILTTFASWIAWGIPIIEIGLSLMLAVNRTRVFALYASFSLMTIFTAYLIAILKFSFYVPCTCGGVLQKLNWDTHIAFNSVFIALAIVGVLISDNSKRTKTY